MQLADQLTFYLKVSRPGLWFATIWLYLLPTSGLDGLIESWAFWAGLLYVCFPLNFLVYGWNDVVDRETDALNPRKNSFWFGARGSEIQLKQLWKPLLVVQLLAIPILLFFGGWQILLVFAGFFAINGLYNLPQHGLRSMPPLELLCQVGYLLVVPLSMLLNNTGALPWQTFLYLFLFCVQSHLMGEVMDIVPDRAAGRKTTATVLGTRGIKLVIIAIVCAEVALMFFTYHEYVFGGVLAAGLVWLIADVLVIFRDKVYSLNQMKFFALASNALGFATIAYVWYSGCLNEIG